MIAAGTTIRSYRIKNPLGSGAKGQVDVARDSRDKRLLAIKVLAHHLAAGWESASSLPPGRAGGGSFDTPRYCADL